MNRGGITVEGWDHRRRPQQPHNTNATTDAAQKLISIGKPTGHNFPFNLSAGHQTLYPIHEQSSPRIAAAAFRFTDEANTLFDDSTDDGRSSMNSGYRQEYGIGMALGSPTHQPMNVRSDHNILLPDRSESPDTLENVIDIWHDQPPLAKSKPSKWKSLGGLFGKRQPRANQAFYQVQHEAPAKRSMDEPHHRRPPSPAPSSDREAYKSATNGAKAKRTPSKGRPDPTRSASAPLDFDFTSKRGLSLPTYQIGGGPMLQVEIPDVHLERYSVMFSGVLNKDATQSSSLLSRRQATLDKLKPVSEDVAEQTPKRAELEENLLQIQHITHPLPSKSPGLLLFPPSYGPKIPSPRTAHGLQRSNTSPAALSPNKQRFEISLLPSETDKEGEYDQRAHKDRKPSAALTSPWSQDISHFLADSPTLSQENTYDSGVSNPHFEEIEWDMAPNTYPARLPTPPSSVPSASPKKSSQHIRQGIPEIAPTAATITLPSSAFTPAPKMQRSNTVKAMAEFPPSNAFRGRAQTLTTISASPTSFPSAITIPQESLSRLNPSQRTVEAEIAAESAASISIARQISVSKQQRQLLVNNVSSTRPRRGPANVATTIGGVTSLPSTPRPVKPVQLIDIRKVTGGSRQGSIAPNSQSRASPRPLSPVSPMGSDDEFNEPHPGTKIPLSKGSVPLNGVGSNISAPKPYKPDPRPRPQPSMSSVPPATAPKVQRPHPRSSSGPGHQKSGSVRAARLALAAMSIPKGEVVLGLDGHGMGTTASGISGGGGERLLVQERKQSTPTLVQVYAGPDVIDMNSVRQERRGGGAQYLGPQGGRGHVHRKSERAVIEDESV